MVTKFVLQINKAPFTMYEVRIGGSRDSQKKKKLYVAVVVGVVGVGD